MNDQDRSGRQDQRGEEQDQRADRMSARGREQDQRGEEQDLRGDRIDEERSPRSSLEKALKTAGDAASHGPVYRAVIVIGSLLLILILGLGAAFLTEVNHRNDLEEIRDTRGEANRQDLKRIVTRLDECTTPPEQRQRDGEAARPDDCYQRGQDRGQEFVDSLICYLAETHGRPPPEATACKGG